MYNIEHKGNKNSVWEKVVLILGERKKPKSEKYRDKVQRNIAFLTTPFNNSRRKREIEVFN